MMNKKGTDAFLVTVLLTLALQAGAQQGFNALSWRMTTAFNSYLLREVHLQYDERSKKLSEAFRSEEAMVRYRDECVGRYKKIIGQLPGPSELNASVTGVSVQDGFTVEKIIFESVPHRYVTANLYLPVGKGPFPAALELCGHGTGGKIPSSKAAILFALNGIAVLVVDPIGQGERIQYLDSHNQPLTRGATTEHTLLNAGANLVGSSMAACEYWDNHRAIDYLETRPDIDKTRIGAYGSSGGGTQTAYLVGLDPRIRVASVCSYFSQRERVLELSGPSDGCQHIPFEGREQLEIADFVLMMAPKPLLIMSGLYDFVDYQGAQQGYQELQQAYKVLGSPEKVSMFTIEGGHGMPKPKREELVNWFRKWMLGKDDPVKETRDITLPASDLQCTVTGQVLSSMPDQVTVQDFNRMQAEQLRTARSEFIKNDSKIVRAKVREMLGLNIPQGSVTAEQTGFTKMRTFDLARYQVICPGQFPVPAVVCFPETGSSKSNVVLYLNDGGKEEILADETTLGRFVSQGDILVVADLRGFGETTDPAGLNDSKYWNREYRNAMISLHIGKPLMGQRVADIQSLLGFVESEPRLKGHPVTVIANGAYGPAVVHAAYLDPRISKAEISGSVKSFEELLRNSMQKDIFSNVLYGVLNFYDLPDLVRLSGKNRIQFTD